MTAKIDAAALDQLFLSARSYHAWTDRPIAEATIRELYDLVKMGPTAFNGCPARFVWVTSPAGKAALAELAMAGNKPQILAAPVTAIVGHDLAFPETLPALLPGRGEAVKGLFADSGLLESSAFRNGSLQGAYLVLAARALGLDCCPMSGFDNAGVDAAFFAGTAIRSNFICTLGYGDRGALTPRNPRLSFEEAGRFA